MKRTVSRRRLLAAGATTAVLPRLRAQSRLRLTLACWDYDRTRPLMDGRVKVEGVDLNYLNLPVEETFFRMLRSREFDASEMSLSSYVVSLFDPDPPFIAIPVFPSRFFRHSCIYINAASGIRQPQDLRGKRVGTPEYQMTAGVWIRGILADEYGVAVSSPSYFTGGQEEPGRSEKLPLALPPSIRLEPIPPQQTLARMIESGAIDALYTARAPSTFGNGSGRVRRLFENYEAVERAYYQKTKIFPIMHTVVIRRDVYRANPWLAQSLYKAFVLAQRTAYEDLRQSAALKTMLPWALSEYEQTEALMGRDYWAYGYEANLATLATFLRYSFEQGLARRPLEPKELFAAEPLESFKI